MADFAMSMHKIFHYGTLFFTVLYHFYVFVLASYAQPHCRDAEKTLRHTALVVIKWQHISKLWIFNVTEVSVSHLVQYCVRELNAEQCVCYHRLIM